MKKQLLILGILTASLFSCKQCIECKYATLKGTTVEKFCSSTKQDRIDFELQMNEEAQQNNSNAICTKEKY
jgi:hypothetical protein